MKAAMGVVAGTVVLFLLAGLGLWLWGEEPTGPPTPPPVPRREAGPEEFRQWLRQLPPTQKVGILRVLISSLREDVTEQQRRAAEQLFHKADTDGNGQLSFEEAWQAGLFRQVLGRQVRPGAGAPTGPAQLEERERSQAERRPGPQANREPRGQGAGERRPGPEANVEPEEQPPFPTNELEQDLLESWELLQDLNIIAQDTGEK
jgi:hypothetical protein